MNKKALYVVLLLVASCIASFGQVEKGNKFIQIGFGSNSDYYGDKAGDGMPIGFSFEYGFSKIFSAGPGIDLIMTEVTAGGMYGTILGICPAGRVSFHLTPDLKKFDLYIGANGGVRQFLYSDSFKGLLPDSFDNGSFFAGHVGAHILFTRKFGIYFEVNAGSNVPNLAKAGIALKF